MQNKKSSHYHFFTTFSLHFTLYSHALFGILFHELTSQNQGNDVQLPATCWQSKSMEMMTIFFHARALAQLLGYPTHILRTHHVLRHMMCTPLYGRKCRHAVTCRCHSLQSGILSPLLRRAPVLSAPVHTLHIAFMVP